MKGNKKKTAEAPIPSKGPKAAPKQFSVLLWALVAFVVVDIFLLLLLFKGLPMIETPLPASATPLPTWVLLEPTVEMVPTEPATPSPTLPPPTIPPTPLPFFSGPFTYGLSFGGRSLIAYRLGTGPSVRAIVGGIHGGYEWNTVELVSDTLHYLQENPQEIPDAVTLLVIPCANPDGYYAGTDAVVARMNGNGVDLNRNWGYNWQPTATHGTRPVSAGSGEFSEPETASLRNLLEENEVEAVIFYHSAMGKIFSGADRMSSATFELAEEMAQATGYPHAPEGIPGQITTGDAIDYLSTRGIAGVEIELLTHDAVDDAEWQRNLQGLWAFLHWNLGANSPATPLPVNSTGWVEYIVQPGETLSDIAWRCGADWADLANANGLPDPYWIREGQTLRVPAACAVIEDE